MTVPPAGSGNCRLVVEGGQISEHRRFRILQFFLNADKYTLPFDGMFEREFGSGEKAYRDAQLLLRGKAARGYAIETARNKPHSNLGWTECNSMQAIITHGILHGSPHPGNVARNADGFLDRRQNIEWSCLVAPEPMRTHYC